jgi:hypothetical protein
MGCKNRKYAVKLLIEGDRKIILENFLKNLMGLMKIPIFANLLKERRLDLVAQLVEQYTFNVWALGSSPSQITKTKPSQFYETVFYFA